MKNLTSEAITIQCSKGGRITLQPARVTPTLEVADGGPVGELNGVLICTLTTRVVDFSGIALDRKEAPFIVSADIFQTLPCNATDFITPDLGMSAIRNSFNEVHAVTQFISKTPLANIPFV